ncbi:hypothetical protein LZ496_12680 [Sphingomonas sp. NSE70-1]|uniref:Uncharacterized protein n=1 Tax=Sphingomonas caseinilyticus TaxID=2908205 RepID=A0ABT0RX82_9SPHN|nr:hypothetical protein [Sphingomonas caseinilyticus]MCL6699634.1 hypothetical protein [Sphingomonas caseinilyticus]
MGQESDDIVSLPAPPPPNPAARRIAIDTAMRKFDGIEEPAKPRTRPGIFGWAATHRRATGGLVTAALIAVVGIPAMQIAIRNQPQEVASERAEPSLPTANVQSIDSNPAPDAAALPAEPAPEPPATSVPLARNEPIAAPEEARALAKQEQPGFTDARPEQKARVATTAPLLSARPASPMASVAPAPPPPAPPPPPPPPPLAPMAEREAADAVAAQSENIVVTGTLARRQNMKSAAPVAEVTAQEAYDDFNDKLQSAFQANNSAAILRLIGFPLKVDFNGDVRTYRTRSEVERDYDRIFTIEVRQSVLNGQPGRHLTFAPQCPRTACPPEATVRIRAVRP